MIIAVSGTPGTGKTYLAKKIAKATGLEYFDLNRYIKENRLYDSYDKKADTYDVDIKKAKKVIEPTLKKNSSKDKSMEKIVGKTMKTDDFLGMLQKKDEKMGGIVVDSHLSHNFSSDYCIIVKAEIKNLNKRLKKRGYASKKIEENIQSEIFEICLEEAKKLKRKIIMIDN